MPATIGTIILTVGGNVAVSAATITAYAATVGMVAINAAMMTASMLYQRNRQNKLKAKQEAEADKQKGYQLVTEGSPQQIPVFYGRNKVGGIRVYHKVTHGYQWDEGGSFTSAPSTYFLSGGDSRIASYDINTKWGICEIRTISGPNSGKLWSYVTHGNVITPDQNNSTVTEIIFTLPASPPQELTISDLSATESITIQQRETASDDEADWRIGTYEIVSVVGSVVTAHLTKVGDGSNTNVTSPVLGSDQTGNRNEYLFIQQVLCHGGINAVYWCDVNEKNFNASDYNADDRQNCHRINVYYNGGADPMVVLNDSTRTNAIFRDIAYASMCFKMYRDKPLYSGIPVVQFYIEGMKVRKFKSSWDPNAPFETNNAYSNNPAECLYDYLTNVKYGKGLTDAEIDLESFYWGTQVCNRVVFADKPRLGKLWDQKGGTRAIKLYECNIGLDTSKPIRENVELLLQCMGNAELLWSAGKYKLQVQYPTEWTNETDPNLVPAGALPPYDLGELVQYGTPPVIYKSKTNNNNVEPEVDIGWESSWERYDIEITDDDIIREESVAISWPNNQEKLNYCTVKFLNESEDFSEDTISWPKKYDNLYDIYLGEDNDIPLETEIYEAGCSDAYHAQSIAEERVRRSRVQTIYSFGTTVKLANLEPGDLINVTSEVLGVTGELMRVEEVKVSERGTATIQAIKFDCRHLAWNAKDDEYVGNRNTYRSEVSQARNLDFIPIDDPDVPSSQNLLSGVLVWDKSRDPRVVGYSIKYTTGNHLSDTQSQLNAIVWEDLGGVSREQTPSVRTIAGNTFDYKFDIPSLKQDTYTFVVVARTSTSEAPRYSPYSGSRWPMASTALSPATSSTIYAELDTNPILVDLNSNGIPLLSDTQASLVATGTFVVKAGDTDVTEYGDVVGVINYWTPGTPYTINSLVRALSTGFVYKVLVTPYTAGATLQSDIDSNKIMLFSGTASSNGPRFEILTSDPDCNVILLNEKGVSDDGDNYSISFPADPPNTVTNKGKYYVRTLVGNAAVIKFRAVYKDKIYDRNLTVQVKSGQVPATGEAPDDPTDNDLSLVGGYSKFAVHFNHGSYITGHGHKETEIFAVRQNPGDPVPTWASTVDGHEKDYRIKVVPYKESPDNPGLKGATYVHTGVEPGSRWYVWIRWVNNDLIASNPNPTGKFVQVAYDLTALFGDLSEGVYNTTIYKWLAAGIDPDMLNALLAINAPELFLQGLIGANLQVKANAISTLETNYLSGALSAHGITTAYNSTLGGGSATIIQEYATKVDLEGATSSIVTGLFSSWDNGNGVPTAASVVDTMTAYAGASGAFAQAIKVTAGSYNGNLAAVLSEQSTKIGSDGTLTNLWGVKMDAYGQCAGFGMTQSLGWIDPNDHTKGCYPTTGFSAFVVKANLFAVVATDDNTNFRAGAGINENTVPFGIIIQAPSPAPPGFGWLNGKLIPIGVYATKAKILEAQIDNATIGLAAVTTLKVDDHAVTVATSSPLNGGPLSATPTEIGSFSVTTTAEGGIEAYNVSANVYFNATNGGTGDANTVGCAVHYGEYGGGFYEIGSSGASLPLGYSGNATAGGAPTLAANKTYIFKVTAWHSGGGSTYNAGGTMWGIGGKK